ncbi:helix-turn-helix domain-containing protein [Paludibacterium denitrificans]|uniref:Helix-turn-helix domain-containing protein n=1 Tax=Paludibacterium denitrificans TaxID=2675226 RepID=A0A844GAQ4_9NEIS|nr:helix-turn-helix transcriptional regulator [Paludibacterium denitrificans]MTD32430.1 helix-turn-helix domain-containing protein [Paludibacterium denitrificans]
MTPMEEARRSRGMTQSELAEKTGCTQGRISHLEKRIARPSPELAKRLAAVLELDVLKILYPGD